MAGHLAGRSRPPLARPCQPRRIVSIRSAGPKQVASGRNDDPINRLRKRKAALDEGLISQADYDGQKAKIMEKLLTDTTHARCPPPVPTDTPPCEDGCRNILMFNDKALALLRYIPGWTSCIQQKKEEPA